MIRIGILGDIGSGKSYVAESFGYPVFNADKEVSKLYRKNKKNYILIYVNAKKKQILKRLKLRKNFNSNILKKLGKTQLKLAQKRKKSDFIINNNFKRNKVKKSVKLIVKKILN